MIVTVVVDTCHFVRHLFSSNVQKIKETFQDEPFSLEEFSVMAELLADFEKRNRKITINPMVSISEILDDVKERL